MSEEARSHEDKLADADIAVKITPAGPELVKLRSPGREELYVYYTLSDDPAWPEQLAAANRKIDELTAEAVERSEAFDTARKMLDSATVAFDATATDLGGKLDLAEVKIADLENEADALRGNLGRRDYLVAELEKRIDLGMEGDAQKTQRFGEERERWREQVRQLELKIKGLTSDGEIVAEVYAMTERLLELLAQAWWVEAGPLYAKLKEAVSRHA
jgi:phage shock protein A